MKNSYHNFVNRKLLFFSVAGILIIEVLIFAIFGTYGKQTTEKRQEALLQESMNSMTSNVSSGKQVIENRFTDMEAIVLVMQNEFAPVFHSEPVLDKDAEKYVITEEGFLVSKVFDPEECGVFYPNVVSFADPKFEKVLKTEAMDSLLKMSVESNQNVIQAYFNSFDTLNRVYPASSDVRQYIGTDIDTTKYQFYYKADQEHNPDRIPVWTDVYLDPIGHGWVMSCIAPIYGEQQLEGVVGIDLNIESLISEAFEISMQMPYIAVLVDQDGEVIAFHDEHKKLFEKEMLKDEYGKILKDELLKEYIDESSYYEILELDFIQDAIQDSSRDMLVIEELPVLEHQEIIAATNINDGKWTFLLAVNERDVFATLHEFNEAFSVQKTLTYSLLVVLTLLIIVFYILRSKNLSSKIVKPIKSLTEQVENYDINTDSKILLGHVQIREIDDLIDSFERMSVKLKEKVQELITVETEKNQQEFRVKMLEEITYLDAVTGIYNRRKMDDLLDSEINRVNRYGGTLSVMIIDLDMFKLINDTYGHNVGDELLKAFSDKVLEHSRKTDYIGRWGGDEFFMICPNTNRDDAFIIASKLKKIVREIKCHEIEISCSIGIAEYVEDTDKQVLYIHADQALYRAKKTGRNKVCVFKENEWRV